jgi:hypothetical protein
VIPVAPQDEPPNFEANVRTPGRAFLKKFRHPGSERFKKSKASYWQACLPELRQAYSEICAYSACWIHLGGTVDHFWPTSVRPDRAFEWDNYRLALSKLNSYKKDSTDVLDPFHIQPGWFVLNFNNLFVEPNVGLTANVETAIQKTITILRLNSDDRLVKLRLAVVKEYARGELTLDYLSRRYPFIAGELQRQNLVEAIKAYNFA